MEMSARSSYYHHLSIGAVFVGAVMLGEGLLLANLVASILGPCLVLAGWRGIQRADDNVDDQSQEQSDDMGTVYLAGYICSAFSGVMLVAAAGVVVHNLGAGIGFLVFALFFGGFGVGAPLLFDRFLNPENADGAVVDSHTMQVDTPSGTIESSHHTVFDRDELTDAEIEEKKRQYEQRPWTIRDTWKNGVLEHSFRGAAERFRFYGPFFGVGALLAGVVLYLLMGPVMGVAVGGGLLGYLGVLGYRRHQKAEKFETTTFELADYPVPLGKAVRGGIETGIPTGKSKPGPLEVELSCFRRYDREAFEGDGLDEPGGSQDNRDVIEKDILWEETFQFELDDPEPESEYYAASIECPIPGDLPPATGPTYTNRIVWSFEASIERPGVNWEVSWELPVFDVNVE